ncbi:hypothetical protein J3Q64DRAFT_1862847 [Phycomyces blakesleeanus]|uniref:RGS domain-containing protein n=1 Tax=Phycomyces blakesleeanus TaxID=4837 RepID=A0ABR3AVL0_PHYBL
MVLEKQAEPTNWRTHNHWLVFSASPEDEWLPTLDQVLKRESRPPVCLYNYYIVLRDRLKLETMLDFWLDVQQAEILYRRYERHLLRQERKSNRPSVIPPQPLQPHPKTPLSTNNSRESDQVVTQMLLTQARHSIATASSQTNSAKSKRPLPPTQTDMMELVERIYLRYIVPHAEKEIMQLPTPLRSEIAQHFAGQITTPTDPHIFGPAKIHIHHLLQLVFPTFVHYKVLMNLTLKQQIGRIVAGLLGLMIGFSLEFSLIFLNIHPWQRRIWVSV